MNKKELTHKLADAFDLPFSFMESVIDNLLQTIINEVCTGNKVKLMNFGTFQQTTRHSKTMINPRTQEKMLIPESKIPTFKPMKLFKDKLKGEENYNN